jgi:hypothetical protein
MIENRPAELNSLPYYQFLPSLPTSTELVQLPEALRLDLMQMCGILPITRQVSEACPNGLHDEPRSEEIAYYMKQKIEFQLIFVVANLFNYRLQDGTLCAYPYSISLIPASKRNKPQIVSAQSALRINLSNVDECIYLRFNPFNGTYGLFGSLNIFIDTKVGGIKTYTDSIGFVVEKFYLAMQFNKRDVLDQGIPKIENKQVRKWFWNYRIKQYYTPFNKVLPRKIWGLDSPIELFLAQAMAKFGLLPTIQTLVFRDGTIYPNFYEMTTFPGRIREERLLTSADFYFSDKKLAVFCDSEQHHSSAEKVAKDKQISESLKILGITPLRLRGRDIQNSPFSCAEIVARTYEQLSIS